MMNAKPQVCVVSQPKSTSNLGGYITDWCRGRGYPVAAVNCRTAFWPRAWPALLAFHPNRDRWFRRRWEIGFYSPAAWDRHTRYNGRILDRVIKPGAKILQVAKEYYPHPRYQEMEYCVFINYNARLSMTDGFTPWRPAPAREAEFIAREERLYRHAAHVFTCGEYLKRSLVEEYGARPERVTAVGNGVNPFYLQNPPPPFADRFSGKLLFVGWDFNLKGGPDVLAAFPLVKAKHPDLELVIVGPDEAQRAAQGAKGAAPGIQWIGPERDRQKLLAHYRQADLFVMPSLRDSYGFVFLEAMSQGLPCIGADLNGMPEIIADGKTGYIVPARSPERLAEAICRYYAEPGHKRRMAEQTHARLLDHFTWDVVMSKVCAVMQI